MLRHSIFSLVVPLRLAGLLRRGFLNAVAARQAGRFIWHSPAVVAGQAAWLAGETAAYAAALARPGQA